jgi:hypothetical protein
VITWGNGTFVQPTTYFALLDHLASHGFIVIATKSRFTFSGDAMIRGVDWVLDEHRNPGSPLHGKVDVNSIGAAGHSQGGAGAVNSGNDPRIKSVVAMQPGKTGNVAGLSGSFFVVAGGKDRIVTDKFVHTNSYSPSTVPAVGASLISGRHSTPTGDGGGYRGYVTAWFAAVLKRDPVAAACFVGLCTICHNDEWEVWK